MLLEIIPDSLYRSPNIHRLLADKKSSILHKTLNNSLVDKEIFLSTTAILFVIKGKQIIINNTKKTEVQQGKLLLLPKDMYLVSDFVTNNDTTFEALLFFIDDSLIEKFAITSSTLFKAVDSPENKKRIVTLQANIQIICYINALINVYRETVCNTHLLELKLMELLQLIKLQNESGEFLSALSDLSLPGKRRNIKNFMLENQFKNLKVKDYALLTGRSLSTFIREFKQLYNTTPNQWLIKQRLTKAHNLLKKTNFNVTETAFEVGYENVSHFITAYKKQYGSTPKTTKKGSMTK